jgi:hypothetical protein
MLYLQPRLSFLILGLTLLLLLGAWWSIGQGRLYLSTYSGKLYDANVLWLNQKSEVKQEFVANYPGLSQVDVFIKWQNDSPDKTPITFYLRETCDGENNLNAQQATYPSGMIDGRTFYSFSFPPLAESINQKYCLILKSDVPADEQNLIGVLASNADLYPEGRTFYQSPSSPKIGPDSVKAPVLLSHSSIEHLLFLPIILTATPDYKNIDVAFQLHYAGWHFETLSAFFMQLVGHKPYLWGSPWFYIILVIFYISAVTAFIGTIIRDYV